MFVVWALTAAAAINWGAVGLLDYNIATDLLGLASNNLDLAYMALGAAGVIDGLETLGKL